MGRSRELLEIERVTPAFGVEPLGQPGHVVSEQLSGLGKGQGCQLGAGEDTSTLCACESRGEALRDLAGTQRERQEYGRRWWPS